MALERAALEHGILAGDALLPKARFQRTHYVDIDAPPEAVWPWLVQMGRRRGGWYSWDLLDNGGTPSVGRIVPELQTLAVGDILPIKAQGPDGFSVLVLDPPRALVLGDASLLAEREGPHDITPRGTWAFSLERRGGATRLVVRVRVEYEPSSITALLRPLVSGLHELMEQKQLRTLKRLVEGELGAPSTLRALVGSGDRIGLTTLPVLALGLLLNVLRPAFFSVGGPALPLVVLAATMLALGVALWLSSVVLLLTRVPRKELITVGPYAVMKHPLYTGVALLVLPAVGLLLDSWVGVPIGLWLYGASRLFWADEERSLATEFGARWIEYSRKVWLPWL